MSGAADKVWMCMNCGYIYNETLGDPQGGIAPGTAWQDIPETWICPDCSTRKSEFEMTEI